MYSHRLVQYVVPDRQLKYLRSNRPSYQPCSNKTIIKLYNLYYLLPEIDRYYYFTQLNWGKYLTIKVVIYYSRLEYLVTFLKPAPVKLRLLKLEKEKKRKNRYDKRFQSLESRISSILTIDDLKLKLKHELELCVDFAWV